MDPLQLLILLVIAGICGAVAELIVGFSPPGLHVMLVSIIIRHHQDLVIYYFCTI